ncbi:MULTISPECIES: SPOR domain-containing protein [Stenotrophomonas]|uniref:SPOR domain-containing protein n=1 Tax=Stenotrophomonas TaxID=40323 RepID=UPI001CF45462|nr:MULTISPECIES: SPOR domain-containing protein [Stenotrophomonas]MCA7023562.1 SPOR domain-containing protein [Stenotrophomonas acidaminiphila]MCE4075307.1 SPOR domain-containing protein [Stenotrophomonas acidaminiphila]
MLIRFLIVALAILNLGVALWWMTPRPAPAAAPEVRETGVATLELVPMDAVDAGAPAVPAPAAVAAAPAPAALQDAAKATATSAVATPAPATPEPTAAAPSRPLQCSSFGPFQSREQAQAAAAALGADLSRSQLREVQPKAASYRVLTSQAASREEAQAMARRIVEAGFSDYFIIAQGDDANAVALGQYRNREGAERRMAALAAAGFPVRIVGNGVEAGASWWLDVAHAATVAADDLHRRSGAAQRQALECARLR